MPVSFRHSAGFGKRMEYWIAGLMLKEGIDVYMPLIDDNGIDAVIRKPDGTFIEVQIKARSKDVSMGDAALFAAITHEPRDNYYFVFYSERLEQFWIMSSEDFIKESNQNKTGKNVGKRSIWFNGKRKDKETGVYSEHCHAKFDQYKVANFSKLVEIKERVEDDIVLEGGSDRL
ncbi:restriction endonuclease [Vibrio alginolyticus]|uniref:restriction endonuclease n=1 Tax=Vibrio alginolyticus TaxID=663 RepID=UPI00215BFCAB|nr:restriction endonuclease [Vibrio alginolyticus]MCR9531717.1 restriction endonuclease [Vibrio alginolyticus]